MRAHYGKSQLGKARPSVSLHLVQSTCMSDYKRGFTGEEIMVEVVDEDVR
jgi:hypothetical protein